MKYRFVFLFIIVLLGCNDYQDPKKEISNKKEEVKQTPTTGFKSLDANSIGVDFVNQINENEEQNHLVWDAVYYGGGTAIGDFNNDGLQDIYFTGNQVDDALYINKGSLEFEKVLNSGIEIPGTWSNGVSLVDVNNDGFLDVYVCKSGWLKDAEMMDLRRNKLFINNGDLTFTEKAKEYGLDNEGYSTQASWLDYDMDGDLDMFLLNAPSNNINYKANYYTKNSFPDFCSDKLFRNDGNETFVDVSEESGVKAMSYGLGVVSKDLNHDGLVDIYVANDYERPDYFYINKGDGTFTNELNDKVKHTSYTAMGVDANDVNNDCLIDLTVLDMQSEDHFRSKTNMPTMQPEVFWSWVQKGYNYQYSTNTLQLNNGVGFFSDVAQMANIASTDWSWSVLCEDFNEDTYSDIYITNGINRDIQNNDFALKFEELNKKGQKIDLFEFAKETPSNSIPNYLFENSGDLVFENKTADYGVGAPSFSYGSALGDLDNDGHLDILVNNNNMAPFIYHNQSKGNWLNIEANAGEKNANGIGVKAVIFYGDKKQYKELNAVRGYQSCSQPLIHFGLSSLGKIDSLLVLFPNGKSIKQNNIKANQLLTFDIKDAVKQSYNVYGNINRYFTDHSEVLDFSHQENSFDDFEGEILLPHMQTRMGPFASVGDVNGDGVDDVYIGGAANQSGKLLLGNSDGGSFQELAGPWSADKAYEDMGTVFFDLDGDKDLDLYVVSGGGHLAEGSDGYADRIYINNGNGFSKQESGITTNGSCVKASDMDNDGDLDLFIGGRGTPSLYPQNQDSYILKNENGKMIVSDSNNLMDYCGIVTDAEWIDFDKDGDDDLMVVGEWMAPTLFVNDNGSLLYSDLNSNWSDKTGWWHSIEKSDMDKDGNMDLILGNIGTNNKFHVSDKKPLRVYQSDFDDNGTNDIILSKISKGNYVPLRGRECSSEQVPEVAENFENYESFAKAKIEDVYGEELNSALMLEVREFRSGVFHNTGSNFEFIPFPNIAQIAPVKGLIVDDFNKDGNLDVIIAGNYFDSEVETTRHDSGNGLILLGNGNFEFEYQNALYSGFYAPGNVKGLYPIQTKEGKGVIVCNNNSAVKLFTY